MFSGGADALSSWILGESQVYALVMLLERQLADGGSEARHDQTFWCIEDVAAEERNVGSSTNCTGDVQSAVVVW